MTFERGDRVIATDSYNWVSKGTKGVIVEPAGLFDGPTVAFETGKTTTYPMSKLHKI